MSEKPSFWQTFPGVITGIATICTALLALIPLFNAFGGGDDDPEPSDGPSPTETATTTARGTTRGTGGGSSGGAPRAVVAPRSVDFGRVGSGRTADATVTVANTGDEFLVIESVVVTGRDDLFTVQAEPCLSPSGIEPGSDCEITVTFRPGSPGNYAGVLEIEHSGEGSPDQVALSGEGALLGL